MNNNNISPFVEPNLDNDSGFLMLRVSKLWEASHDRALKKHYNISHMQYAVLASIHWLILHGHNDVTQISLSKHTKISPMTISQAIKGLEEKGYVCRKSSMVDMRAKCSNLTEEGKKLLNDAFISIFSSDERFFNILGKNRQKFNGYMLNLLVSNDYM
ncbi:MAG: MarR family transcriptional regulator [Paludibacter sp.]|nr:MarR family transcriptional regulator [Paludibacter sp.]